MLKKRHKEYPMEYHCNGETVNVGEESFKLWCDVPYRFHSAEYFTDSEYDVQLVDSIYMEARDGTVKPIDFVIRHWDEIADQLVDRIADFHERAAAEMRRGAE